MSSTHVLVVTAVGLDVFLEQRSLQVLSEHICTVVVSGDSLNLIDPFFLEIAQEPLSDINMPGSATNTPIMSKVFGSFVINFQNYWLEDFKSDRLHMTRTTNSMSWVHCVAAASSASVTDNVT